MNFKKFFFIGICSIFLYVLFIFSMSVYATSSLEEQIEVLKVDMEYGNDRFEGYFLEAKELIAENKYEQWLQKLDIYLADTFFPNCWALELYKDTLKLLWKDSAYKQYNLRYKLCNDSITSKEFDDFIDSIDDSNEYLDEYIYTIKRFFYFEKYKELYNNPRYQDTRNIKLTNIIHNAWDYPKEYYSELLYDNFLYKPLMVNFYISIYKDELSIQEIRKLLFEILRYEDTYYDYTQSYNSSHEFAYKWLSDIETNPKHKLYFSFKALEYIYTHGDKEKLTQDEIIEKQKHLITQNIAALLLEDPDSVSYFIPYVLKYLWEDWKNFLILYSFKSDSLQSVKNIYSFLQGTWYMVIWYETSIQIFQKYIDNVGFSGSKICIQVQDFLTQNGLDEISLTCPKSLSEDGMQQQGAQDLSSWEEDSINETLESSFWDILKNNIFFIISLFIFFIFFFFIIYILFFHKK